MLVPANTSKLMDVYFQVSVPPGVVSGLETAIRILEVFVSLIILGANGPDGLKSLKFVSTSEPSPATKKLFSDSLLEPPKMFSAEPDLVNASITPLVAVMTVLSPTAAFGSGGIM